MGSRQAPTSTTKLDWTTSLPLSVMCWAHLVRGQVHKSCHTTPVYLWQLQHVLRGFMLSTC